MTLELRHDDNDTPHWKLALLNSNGYFVSPCKAESRKIHSQIVWYAISNQ